MTLHQTTIRLTILGPFMSAATGSSVYGLHRAFHRDARGQILIPQSHIKGKLRMALQESLELEEIATALGPVRTPSLSSLLGRPSEAGAYEPETGSLRFTDFRFRGTARDAVRSRTAIEPVSGTASEQMLRQTEDAFASGAETIWEGRALFASRDEAETARILKLLRLGFTWLTTLGAEKGVGYGRLAKVEIGLPQPLATANASASAAPQALGAGDALQLRIRPKDRLMIGGVKNPRTNFLRSERVVPGTAVKGALASCTLEAYGIDRNSGPFATGPARGTPGLEALATHFDLIRVTHALPVRVGGPRPVRTPLSVVTVRDIEVDLALSADPEGPIDGQAPTYFVDRKDRHDYIGAASPAESLMTRTEINDQSRRSEEGNVFTYASLSPEDDDGQSVEWVCNVDFAAVDPAARAQVRAQFAQAAAAHLVRLGKLNAEVSVEVGAARAVPAETERDLIVDGEAVLTLQTDALMLDPAQVRALAVGTDLLDLYAAYWSEVSGQSLALVDFLARQTFQGGYLYHRYPGTGERQTHPNRYEPFYLTGAGSVFRLRVVDAAAARPLLERWRETGLSVPEWARTRYSAGEGRALWQNCPFIPENGFGEIAINLDLHWRLRAGLERAAQPIV